MPKLSLYRNQSIDLQRNAVDWFLHDGNIKMPNSSTAENRSVLVPKLKPAIIQNMNSRT